jgi:hypothetical protein
MPRRACIFCLAAFAALSTFPAASQTPVPDVRGTWKGESESLVLGGGTRTIPRPGRASPSCAAFRSP